MTNSEWESRRSVFNHGWLKNRFIACLLKCRRVITGLVQDDRARDDFLDLIDGWDFIRPIAEEILTEMKFRIHNSVSPSALDTSALGEANCRYLLEVDRLRWLHVADAALRAQEASAALQEFDAEARRVRANLEATDTIPESKYLQRLEERARSLGKAFSAVSLCQDTILSANEYH